MDSRRRHRLAPGRLLALVFANGFFVAAEFSIVTVRKTRIDQLIAEGHRGARAVRRAVSRPGQLHRRDAARHHDGQPRPRLDRRAGARLADRAGARAACRPRSPTPTAHTIAVAIAFAIITALHIVLGELAPKTIALERAEATALWVVKPTELFMRVFWPFIRLLNGMGRAVVQPARPAEPRRPRAGALGRRAEDARHGEPGGGRARGGGRADAPPRVRLRRPHGGPGDGAAHRDGRRRGRRASRETLHRPRRRARAIRACRSTATNLDNIVGILHVTDVVKALAAGDRATSTPATLAREALTVPETMTADDLLAAIRAARRRARRSSSTSTAARPGSSRSSR